MFYTTAPLQALERPELHISPSAKVISFLSMAPTVMRKLNIHYPVDIVKGV